MADNKKENEEQTQAQSYDVAALTSRQAVEDAMANTQYTPSQNVTDAAEALRQWQQNRPEQYQSSYQSKIDSALEQLLGRKSFDYSYTQDPLYSQYAQVYTQNARNASADAAAQAAALTGGYGSSYAVSAAQQAYQQQIGALNSAIPTLYSLALDTYNSEGDDMVAKLDQLNTSEQNAQTLYDKQLSDYYTQLEQKGEAYNSAYTQDYSRYKDYLSQLDTLHGYYSQQEQTAASQRQQTFNNVMTVLGVIGDAVQLAISGTTGLGSLAGSLINTGYNIYSGNRQYDASRADTEWNRQMQQKQYQDSQAQQQYKNDTAEREYQDALKQQQFDNDVTTQKLNIAKGEWALKQSSAAKTASRAAASAGSTSGTGSGASKSTQSTRSTQSTQSGTGSVVVPYSASRLRSQGKSDLEIRAALLAEGYSSTQTSKILKQMNS